MQICINCTINDPVSRWPAARVFDVGSGHSIAIAVNNRRSANRATSLVAPGSGHLSAMENDQELLNLPPKQVARFGQKRGGRLGAATVRTKRIETYRSRPHAAVRLLFLARSRTDRGPIARSEVRRPPDAFRQ